MSALRRAVRWGLVAMLPGELVLVVCLAAGVTIPAAAVRAVEMAVLALLLALAALLGADYRRHRGGGLDRGTAAAAAVRDTVPAAVRRLTVHELKLATSFVRWVARRPPHGVRRGDLAVPYAPGQSFVIYGFLFVSVVETVALYFLLLRWPAVHIPVLVLDVWGLYFIVALHAACHVRPHVVRADGSLHLRYGVLLEVRVPAGLIASVRTERRFPDGSGMARVDDDGTLDLAVGNQTTVTVELTGPVAFVRPLGKEAEARVVRFYAEDPAPVVAALRQVRSAPETPRAPLP